jgi:hypothetical protein
MIQVFDISDRKEMVRRLSSRERNFKNLEEKAWPPAKKRCQERAVS